MIHHDSWVFSASMGPTHYGRKVENSSMREAPLGFGFCSVSSLRAKIGITPTPGHNIFTKYASGTICHPKIQPRDGR